uniref:WYL domain-containing protein n=1 Tax=Acidihalobacter yilgarnensis TaxID=2819280 RepID=UPI003899184A
MSGILGDAWTVGAWCRLREDFRNFRIDRLTRIEDSGENFGDGVGRDLAAYLKAVGAPNQLP